MPRDTGALPTQVRNVGRVLPQRLSEGARLVRLGLAWLPVQSLLRRGLRHAKPVAAAAAFALHAGPSPSSTHRREGGSNHLLLAAVQQPHVPSRLRHVSVFSLTKNYSHYSHSTSISGPIAFTHPSAKLDSENRNATLPLPFTAISLLLTSACGPNISEAIHSAYSSSLLASRPV